MRYFISDIHIQHRLMLRTRGYESFEAMHDDIVKRWNSKVTKGDTVYIIGDVSFGDYEQTKAVLDRLNGQKILIKGNHDRHNKRKMRTSEFLKMGFKDVMDEDIIKIHDDKTGQKVDFYLKHYPYSWHPLKEWWQRLRKKAVHRSYNQLYPKYTEMWHIHGHHHGGDEVHDNEINVSWETVGGVPVCETKILEIRRKQLDKPRWMRYIERIIGRTLTGAVDYHEDY